VRKHLQARQDDPLVFSSQRLHRQPGSSNTIQRDVEIARDWRNEVSSAQAGSVILVDFLLESAHDGILVSATARIPVTAECVRCLEPLAWSEEVAVQQFFAYPESAPNPEDENNEDVAIMADDLLDLNTAFRDAVVLALPLSPRCSDDCLGLCSDCGFVLAEDPDHKHDRIDPRWSALADTRFSDHLTKESD
jgi:uncharacterized protein